MKRTKLADRPLPDYTKGEERMNIITHIIGGGLGLIALVLCILRSALHADAYAVVGSCIYGVCLIGLYTMSSVYHGLKPCTGKKVMQVMDHCTIYFLIAGTYTPVLLSGIRPVYPGLGWGLLAFQWGLALTAGVFTAIDLHLYRHISMTCYILMGWSIIFFLPVALEVLTKPGFALMLAGGIAYTVGAILYGIGSKRRWFHSVFHIFVLLGSILQFFSIYLYVI